MRQVSLPVLAAVLACAAQHTADALRGAGLSVRALPLHRVDADILRAHRRALFIAETSLDGMTFFVWWCLANRFSVFESQAHSWNIIEGDSTKSHSVATPEKYAHFWWPPRTWCMRWPNSWNIVSTSL